MACLKVLAVWGLYVLALEMGIRIPTLWSPLTKLLLLRCLSFLLSSP